MNPSITLLFFYLIAAIIIGIVHRLNLKSKGGMTLSHFTINNRDTSFFLLTTTIFATFAGGGLVFGYMELGHRLGVGAIYVAMSFFVGLLFAATVAPKIWHLGNSNKWIEFTDFMVNRVGTGIRFPVALVNIAIFFAIMAAQLVAMARIIELIMDTHFLLSLGAISVVVYFYTAIAGLGGVYWTDLFQSLIVLLVTGVVLAPFAFSETSIQALQGLPEGMITGETAGLTLIIGALVFVAPSLLVRSDSWQRILSARNHKVARRSFVVAAVLIAPMYIIFPVLGMLSRTKIETAPNLTTIPFEFLSQSFADQPWTLAIVLLSLFAVLMSSCDSYLHLVSVIFSRLYNKKSWETWDGFENSLEATSPNSTKDKTEKKIMRSILIIMGILIVGGFLVAAVVPSIVDLMIVALSIVLVFLPTTAHALLKGRGSEPAALISIYGGLIVFGIAFILALTNVWGRTDQAFVFGVVFSLLAYLITLKLNSRSAQG